MMSSDNHINNNMRISEIDIAKLSGLNGITPTRQVYMTREEFDLLQTKNLDTLYIVVNPDDDTHAIYFGNTRIPNPEDDPYPMYVMGINDNNEYEIYQVMKSWSDHSKSLIPIIRFNDPQKAVDTLHKYKHIGSATQHALKTHIAITAYVKKECGLHECITSIIANLGYRDDPKLQVLNEITATFRYKTGSRELPSQLRISLHNLAASHPESLLPIYSQIYDVFDKYEYFDDPKYTEAADDEMDLKEPVAEILKIFNFNMDGTCVYPSRGYNH